MTGWLFVFAAGLAEVAGVIAMNAIKQRPGALAYARLVACFGVSFGLLSLGLKSGMSIAIAYAVWVGIGTVGAVVVGILRYGESARPLRLFCVALVLAAVVGLKLIG
ncbi:SMR family transporter [Luteimonas sp. 3794]|uniref:DMT family transporter n=1 Tax=Luteimonas sp. 3794 TaxID=2817730 RepID=UPI00285C286D|nr:SMR family transporter [Luteimonas sp. 3794]MDR6991421.1 paired small multidrug resistance pump [Luteimonas sp. 3794]